MTTMIKATTTELRFTGRRIGLRAKAATPDRLMVPESGDSLIDGNTALRKLNMNPQIIGNPDKYDIAIVLLIT